MGGIILAETKTKGEIDEEQIKRQLKWDLQTMLYLIALKEWQDGGNQPAGMKECFLITPILGVRYNVIRRPLSGGKGTIVQGKGTQGNKCPKCKGDGRAYLEVSSGDRLGTCIKCKGVGRVGGKPPETKEEYYARLAQYIKDEPDSWFMRWNVTVSQADVAAFKRQCLDPILENLADDYEWWAWMKESGQDPFSDKDWEAEAEYCLRGRQFPKHCPRHYREPFGIYDPIKEGGSTDLDYYLETGSTVGLGRSENLFPELTGG